MDRIPVHPWKRLLERRMAEHYRRFHPETFTRRGFLGAAAGAVGLAAASLFSLVPLAVADDNEPTTEPNPIPGGATAFGFHVHHNVPESRFGIFLDNGTAPLMPNAALATHSCPTLSQRRR